MLVGIEQTAVTGMSESLMPQQSFCGSLDGRDGSVGLNAFMERELVELHGQLGHLVTQLGLSGLVVSMHCQSGCLATLFSKLGVTFNCQDA